MKLFFRQKICFTILALLTMNISVMAQKYKTVTEVKGLNVGTKAPMFTARDDNNVKYKLEKALKKGPVVVLFYRGQWCPVCNKYLSRLQDSLQQIYDKGATVVAISPEKSAFLKQTRVKTNASFTLLYDNNYVIGDAFDVTFKPEDKIINLYNEKLNAQFERSHSDDSVRLPVPATFIINKKGIIVWRHFNPDYRIRAGVKDIINNIPAN
ncbi:MAG: peroxiredoxin-like family protein [Ferruginibacter sp.]